jgi:hypothetical protein
LDIDLATLSVDGIKTYLEDFRSGKLEPHLKSEPIPEEQGALTVLVGKNW